MASDLKTDNMAQVIAGGTADVVGDASTSMRKKRTGPGLSNQLGINV